MIIKHKISFGLKTSVTPADKLCGGDRDYPIRMRVTYNGVRVDVPIKIAINKKYWDTDNQCVIKDGVNEHGDTAADINAAIAEYLSYTEDIFKSYEIQKVIPSPDMLKDAITRSFSSKTLNLSDKKKKSQELSTVFKLFMKECGIKNAWTDATYEKFNALWSDLSSFNPKLTFDDFTEEGLTQFLVYLRDKKVVHPEVKDKNGTVIKEAQIGHRNTTIGKKFDFLTWFLNWATKKGYNTCNDYTEFDPKLKKTNESIVYLTQREIKKLCDYNIPEDKKHLERVRDVFVFCCYSGLRHSDVYNLRKGDVKDEVFDVTTIKTADSLRIDFNTISRAIINKYKDVPIPGGKALPVISNQKMNDELKELCMLAGIDEPFRDTYYIGKDRYDDIGPKYKFITTHVGRKSFICNALALGIPVDVVMKWTGHSDYRSMKPYIAVADEIKAKEMMKFNASDIHIT